MKKIKRTLPIAATAFLLTAGSIVSSASVQAETTNASPTASTSATNTTPADTRAKRAEANSPAELLKLLGERIKAEDVDGIIALHEPQAAVVDYDGSVVRGHKEIREFYVEWFKSDPVLTVDPHQTTVAGGSRGSDGEIHGQTAAVMGKYTLEQTGPDGSRETFTGDFCDTVKEQPDGTWLYILDNPYPPH